MLLKGVVSTLGRPLPIVVETGWNCSELADGAVERNGDLPSHLVPLPSSLLGGAAVCGRAGETLSWLLRGRCAGVRSYLLSREI